MNKVMMTLDFTEQMPTLDQIRRQYGLSEQDIDESFGVVEIDDHACTILVSAEGAAKIQPSAGWDVKGPYANPIISHFGLG